MADTIHFTLRNNQMSDVTVTVVDQRTGAQVLANVPLNQNQSVTVEVVADSDGRGAAQWFFAGGDVNSNKGNPSINDGDELTLG